MIKYRLGFTMSAETLFALMGKVLPIEDLSVEEIAPTPMRVARQLADSGPRPQLAKPKRKGRRRPDSYKPNLEAGTNAIILKVLADGEAHRTREIKDAYTASGFTSNGTGSSIERMRKWSIVERAGVGQWRLTKEYMQKQRA